MSNSDRLDEPAQISGNAFDEREVEAVRLAHEGDIAGALAALAQFDERGQKVDASIAMTVVECAWAAKAHKPKQKRGRPPLSPGERLLRVLDGARAIVGEEPRITRGVRDLQRCRTEARAIFGKKLEKLGGPEVFELKVLLGDAPPTEREGLLRRLFKIGSGAALYRPPSAKRLKIREKPPKLNKFRQKLF